MEAGLSPQNAYQADLIAHRADTWWPKANQTGKTIIELGLHKHMTDRGEMLMISARGGLGI